MNPLQQPYSGTWTAREARHLLWRVGFGATNEEVARCVKEGLQKSVATFLSQQPESAEFQQSEASLKLAATTSGEAVDLKAWWLYRMLYSGNPLVEKLTLMWHNHFATSIAKVRSVPQMLAQNELFRAQAWGNFRELLHGVSKDVAMLVWLDGNANRKRHPNENFAREVMELFSLGVGNYSERDIQEAARAFSGWHVREGDFWFNELQHDDSAKTIFGKTGNFQGQHVVDLCLDHPACLKFIGYKILKQFVLSNPSPDQIVAVAERLQQHQYRLQPVLAELFTSAWFYSAEVRNRLIKSPVDLVIGTCRTLKIPAKIPPVLNVLAELGQDILQPPSVKGWDGGRAWISATTAILRANFVLVASSSERLGRLASLSKLWPEIPDSPTEAIRQTAEMLLNQTLSPSISEQMTALWSSSSNSFDQRLETQIQTIGLQPEFQFH